LIVTLTMNPAIDRTIAVDRLAFDDRAYILSSKDSPGGRGINAASVIHSMGGKTLAIVPTGGERGAQLESYMHDCGFPVTAVPIKNDIRRNFTITDRNGLTVKLNELGPRMSKEELHAVETAVAAQLPKASWLMLCGSLPPGVPAGFYSALIASAKAKKVQTLLDTDGDSLIQIIESGPTVVTPNQQEAERVLNTVLLTRSHSFSAARKIQSLGADSVVLSLGSRGAVGATATDLWEAVPPRVDAISPIGAGDAMAAAFMWSLQKGDAFPEALRWGVAAGTASAKLPGMTFATLAQTREIYEDVDIRRVEL
jgi:1-phosphofructokinase family hexose kinase